MHAEVSAAVCHFKVSFVDPAAGQGLNMTFEDAAELGWHVQQMGLTPEALRAFELERIPRVGVIVQKAEVCLFWLCVMQHPWSSTRMQQLPHAHAAAALHAAVAT